MRSCSPIRSNDTSSTGAPGSLVGREAVHAFSGVSILVLGVAGAGVLALVVAPMRFSWPRQVRWCVAMQAVAAADPTMVASRIDVREVCLARVAPARDELVVVVREVGRAEWDVTSLASPPPPPDDVALLRDWCDLGTPMLLHRAGDGQVSLVGPVPTATNAFHALTPFA